MNILSRNKFDPIALQIGDSLKIVWSETLGIWPWLHKKVLAEHTFEATDKPMLIDEAVIFETMFENRRAFGGMIVEQE
jgi:hypothetical protein